MRKQRNTSQAKEQDKTTARDPSESEISDMPDGEFRAVFVRILTGLEKDMSEPCYAEINGKHC